MKPFNFECQASGISLYLHPVSAGFIVLIPKKGSNIRITYAYEHKL